MNINKKYYFLFQVFLDFVVALDIFKRGKSVKCLRVNTNAPGIYYSYSLAHCSSDHQSQS